MPRDGEDDEAGPSAKRPRLIGPAGSGGELMTTAAALAASPERRWVSFAAALCFSEQLEQTQTVVYEMTTVAASAQSGSQQQLTPLHSSERRGARRVTFETLSPGMAPCWSSAMTPELISCGLAPFLPIGLGLNSLCVVVGREAARSVRREYLKDNEAFLHHCFSIRGARQSLARKSKMLAWLEVNENWPERCRGENVSMRARYSSIAVANEAEFDALDLIDRATTCEHRFPSYSNSVEGIIYRGGEGVTLNSRTAPKPGDILVGHRRRGLGNRLYPSVSGFGYLKTLFGGEQSHVYFLDFSNDINFIFNDPTVASLFGIRDFLAKVFEGKSNQKRVLVECMDNVCTYTQDVECFKYLLTLPSARDLSDCFLLQALSAGSSFGGRKAVERLKAVLEEFNLDLNRVRVHSHTEVAIHVLLRECHSCEIKLQMLKLLLQHGADARLPDGDGKLPIEILCSTLSSVADRELPAFKEMAAALLG